MAKEYKNSGIPWIGEIPKTWQVMPYKRIMHKEKELLEKYSGEDVLSLTMRGVIVRDLEGGGKMPSTFDGYQKVYSGEILQCLFDIDVTPRCVGLIKNDGITSPAYSRFVVHSNAWAAYYNHQLRYMDDNKVLLHLSKNIRSSLKEDDFGVVNTCVPPLSEQQRIAEFLDRKCGEIDEAIALQEEFIEELKAYKQSVITEAVTRGLNPNVKLKDSGIDWIGKIPQGWELKKVKYVSTSINKGTGITKDEVFEDGDTPCVRYGEIYSKYNGSFVNCKSYTKKNILTAYRYFNTGDILFAGTGELVEEIGKSIVYLGEKPALAGGDIIILSHNQNPVFLNYALNSFYAQTQKSRGKAKLKVVHISSSEIGNIYLMLPPAAEQLQIADYLDNKCAEIDSLIAIKQQKIEELKDYKKSIIYEYVTGKKEVE